MKSVHSNVYFLGLVSFITQIGATIVDGSGLEVIAKNSELFFEEQFVVIKDIGEGSGVPIRILSGYISDFIRDQKRFLIIGYGSIIIFNILFLITGMSDIFPQYIFGYK